MPSPYERYKGGEVSEISSTHGGRHVTLSEGLLNHPTHADNMVDGKDPVTFGATADGYGVGVAFSSAAVATDLIAIDTEGTWNLSVVADDDEGGSAVEIGDIIYINRTTCILSKISSDTTNIVFGYALDTIGSGLTSTIAVKVHWDPHRTDEYRDFSGTGVETAMLIEIDDAATPATGLSHGLKIDYHNIGTKTGDAEVIGAEINMIHTHDVVYDYGLAIYNNSAGNPTIGFKAALSIYSDDMGDSVGGAVGIDIGMAGAHSPADRHAFMRMRAHTGSDVPESVFLLEGNPCADFLVDLAQGGPPWYGAAVGAAANERIAVRVGANIRYLELFVA